MLSRDTSQLQATRDGSFCAGVGSDHTEQDIPFDISIGLPLPGSPDSWEPFNPTFLGLGAPGIAQSRDPARSPDLWGSHDRQLLPSYHDVSAQAAAHCTATACSRASAGEDVVHALDSGPLHGSSTRCTEPFPETPQPRKCHLTLAMPMVCMSHARVHKKVTWHYPVT